MDGAMSADRDFATSKSPYSLGIGQLFLFKDQAGQFVRSALVRNSNRSLQHNRPVIIFIVGEVHCAAADFDTTMNGGLVNVVSIQSVTTERRNK